MLKGEGTEVLTLISYKRENVIRKVEGQKFWAWVHQVLRLLGIKESLEVLIVEGVQKLQCSWEPRSSYVTGKSEILVV